MSALTQAHGSLLYVNNANVSFDALVASGLPENEREEIDLAVHGFADFVSGTYQQKTTDTDDIASTVTVDKANLLAASFKLLTDAPTGATWNFSTVGDDIKDTGSGLVITSASALKPRNDANAANGGAAVSVGSGDWFANLQVWAGSNANVVDGGNVKHGQGIGAVLVQAAGAALFKRLGKNAAISNDKSIEAKQDGLATLIKGVIDEDAEDYSTSKMFKRYLDSARYEADASADVGSTVAYNLDQANFDFIVQVQGTVSDGNGPALDKGTVNRVLGTIGNDNHKVTTDLTYKMNVFMRITQDDELA